MSAITNQKMSEEEYRQVMREGYDCIRNAGKLLGDIPTQNLKDTAKQNNLFRRIAEVILNIPFL